MVSAELLATLCDELDLRMSDETRNEVSEYIRELDTLLTEWDEDPVEEHSSYTMSDDSYNSLLAIYDEPRVTRSDGLLSGLSFAIKDNIAVKGLPMTAGSKGISGIPTTDAIVVERILNAGGAIVGKANMDALAFGPGGQWSEFGSVVNPLDRDRMPGGSSSGSGVAVAAGLVDAALGTDTGGSVRCPAACCGIVGIKPTHRTVPRFGFMEHTPSTDTIGPLARDVETAALVLDVISGVDSRDPTTVPFDEAPFHTGIDKPVSLTVGILDLVGHGVSDPVQDAMADLAEAIKGRTSMETTPVALEMEHIERAFSIIMGAEHAWLMRQRYHQRGGVPQPSDLLPILDQVTANEHIAKRVIPGAYLDAKTGGKSYQIAKKIVHQFDEEMTAVFDDVDVLVTPTMRSLPPKLNAVTSSKDGLKYTMCKQFSLIGVPGVSVPIGTRNGLPVSAQVIAPRFADHRAITVARQFEKLGDVSN